MSKHIMEACQNIQRPRRGEVKSAAQDLIEIYNKLNIFTTEEVCMDALELALTLNITFYDAIYTASAKKLNATLYTVDQKLYNSSKNIIFAELLEA
ncbi:MAG: type II toxin-antitoxin system VapC family toxin [Nitrososphaeria archaeon]|nr:type II toxin-antitoxin system VapC family toxin [Nitrososphaeria archaeon]